MCAAICSSLRGSVKSYIFLGECFFFFFPSKLDLCDVYALA
jgi:hypothetical protein